MNEARWDLAPQAPEAELLSRELGIPLALARVLAGRGVRDARQGEVFLRGTAADLHDPFLMSGMKQAVDRIRRAISSGENILVFGDYDADGVLSVVMLLQALRRLGAKVEHLIPDRMKDGYGLKEAHLAAVREKRADLVISVDCGIRSEEFVRGAAEVGIEVIITDHHLAGPALPPAAAVLDPMLPGESYPYKPLAGVGVVFKLIQALLQDGDRKDDLYHYLKLVAIGTISDVSELRGENRLMVREGLNRLKDVSNPGLKSLLEVCGVRGRSPSEGDVGFRIGPRLNAAGRLESAQLAVDLFMARTSTEALAVALRLDRLNSERQVEEERILRESLEMIRGGGLDRSRKILVLGSEAWHRGVLGIVASKLKDIYYRPVILFHYSPDGLASGSGRSIPEYSLIGCLDACREFFLHYGGHRLAAGCTLRLEKMEEFKSAVNRQADSGLTEDALRRKIKIDAELDLAELGQPFFDAYRLLSPFGVGNPTPLFQTTGAEVVSDPRRLKQKHVKFQVGHSGRVREAIGWGHGDWADELRKGDRLDLAFSIQSSNFHGEESFHLSLQDVRNSG